MIKILLECVLTTCRKYNLTLKLKKGQFLNPRLEFVGVDLTKDGLIPAHSKFNLLRDWQPPPNTKRMHSFVGFASFYKKWIPFFELLIQPFRQVLTKQPVALTNYWKIQENCL